MGLFNIDNQPNPPNTSGQQGPANRPITQSSAGQGRGLLPIIIGVVLVGIALLVLPNLFGGGDDSQTSPAAGDRVQTTNAVQPQIINIESLNTAATLDANGCVATQSANFQRDDLVYVVGQSNFIPAGTSVFARLYHNGQAIEDTQAIVADQDYRDTCINFAFEPVNAGFERGTYEAEFFVNGNAAGTVTFTVQ